MQSDWVIVTHIHDVDGRLINNNKNEKKKKNSHDRFDFQTPVQRQSVCEWQNLCDLRSSSSDGGYMYRRPCAEIVRAKERRERENEWDRFKKQEKNEENKQKHFIAPTISNVTRVIRFIFGKIIRTHSHTHTHALEKKAYAHMRLKSTAANLQYM